MHKGLSNINVLLKLFVVYFLLLKFYKDIKILVLYFYHFFSHIFSHSESITEKCDNHKRTFLWKCVSSDIQLYLHWSIKQPFSSHATMARCKRIVYLVVVWEDDFTTTVLVLQEHSNCVNFRHNKNIQVQLTSNKTHGYPSMKI